MTFQDRNAEEQALRQQVDQTRRIRDKAYNVVSRIVAKMDIVPTDVLDAFNHAQQAFEVATANLDAFLQK